MSNPLLSLRMIVLTEGITLFLLTILAGAYSGQAGAQSTLLAGLTYEIPNWYRAFRTFRYRDPRAVRLILKGFYQGEAVKFVLSVAMFASVFKYCTVNPMIFFGTYIGMQMISWFVPELIKTKGG